MNLISKLIVNRKMELFECNSGKHTFGGKKPENFNIPENSFLGNFQFIGNVSNEDEYFAWLPFSLNLICPILTDFDYLFLDYSNPTSPKMLYPINTAEITSAYKEIDKNSAIDYESKKFDVRKFEGINDENEFEIFGVIGKPHATFTDEPIVFPRCPVTNKEMKFVVQLFSNEHLKTISKNFISEDDYEESIHQYMNFWCDGSLKVFIEPSSKIVAYRIQNT